jgi:hypothetical protein
MMNGRLVGIPRTGLSSVSDTHTPAERSPETALQETQLDEIKGQGNIACS